MSVFYSETCSLHQFTDVNKTYLGYAKIATTNFLTDVEPYQIYT